MDLTPGDVLGRYQLLVVVGEGGMGRVWAARRVGAAVQRLVAVKTARPEYGKDADFARTFVDEARIASGIQHPNVCGIHELGHERSVSYLVMEWSDGATLHELLSALPERKLSPSAAAKIVAAVCAGLHAAHELEDVDGSPLNVIHRDVSPQNVLISTSGHIKVADFGVAKASGQLHAPTMTGEVKGKLSYMAPEQVTSKDIDRRVDIFALGCVLYEITLGERPFHGVDALATMYKIIEGEPDRPTLKDPNYPSELEEIVLKALAKDREQRFQTAEEMRQALERWLHSTRTIVTEAQIGKLITSALGEKIRARNTRINDAIRRLDADEQDTEVRSSQFESVPTTSASAPPVEGTLSRGTWAATGAGRSRHLGRLALMGGAALAASAVVVLLWANGRERPATPAPSPKPTVSAPAVAVPSAAPARVHVSFRAEPADAEIRIDDEVVSNPHVMEREPDTRPHTVRVSAPGYQSATQIVRFDRSQDVNVVLDRDPTPAPVAAGGRPRKSTRATPEPTPSAAASASERAPTPGERLPGQLPPTTGKKKRVLDTDNPFDQE